MQAGPHFIRGNILITFAQRDLEPLIGNYVFNPFPDEQLILDGHCAKTSLPF